MPDTQTMGDCEMTEITDAMVKRYAAAMNNHAWTTLEGIRASLDAALNPPPAPEIVVSEDMEHVGEMQYRKNTGNKGDVGAASIYRAMEIERRKKITDYRNPWHRRAGESPYYHSHRRSGDAT